MREWLVPAKRRNKWKSAMKDKGGKTGRLEDTAADTDTSNCESISDGRELSGTMPDRQEIDLYPSSLFKKFLTQTKGMKGLDLGTYFPDRLRFIRLTLTQCQIVLLLSCKTFQRCFPWDYPLPTLPVFVLPALPVPRTTYLLSAPDYDFCLSVSGSCLLTWFRLLRPPRLRCCSSHSPSLQPIDFVRAQSLKNGLFPVFPCLPEFLFAQADWEKEWEGQVLLSHNTTLSGGVGLLFSRGFTPSSLEVEHVVRGQCLMETEGVLKPSNPKKMALASLLDSQVQVALVRSLIQDLTEMDAPSSFFFGLEKKRRHNLIIDSLLSSTGQELVEPGQIRKWAVEFFSSLYESEYHRDDGLFDEFCGDLPRVSGETNSRLDRPLQLDELHTALLGMKGRKAPGVNGLTVEFFKAFWDIVAHDMLEVFNESLALGSLPLSCRRAVVTLLPKKGNLPEIKNWRPVSLLCMDYRILSKTLASRLREAMEQIIHRDQTYCVPGRFIVVNVHLIRDVLEVSRSLDVDTGLISLDQEKAFDRVEHAFLWKVMERFRFSPGFIAMIRVLYCDIASMLKFNGSLCAPFRVRRGVR
ncbi:Transposon TX1 uncharacterized 149 kDa protein ORF 2 [Takifugu flavidus]|uniref:Transposon TX1 uncharacterized 149 kDa protein ORF 2 n=1 Tax=Takifugu flavidus TaxID=433684 RepID=A0A5C6MSK1_9TELE|nr:Transposon TX1 uncharacterized 149 kDa protein ORF 2 [Takifugu flavidus]